MQQDIRCIHHKLGQMTTLAIRAVEEDVRALAGRDRSLASAVILRDHRIDGLAKELDRLCLSFLVRQQPVAGPLRMAYSTIRASLELERVGDYASSVARQVLKLAGTSAAIPVDRFREIAEQSVAMLRESVQAFIEQDAGRAERAMATEGVVDALKSRLNTDLVQRHREEALPFEALNALMMIARHLERISDQARNICLEALYVSTGEYHRHRGAEFIRLLFVDGGRSSASLIAETIATSLQLPQFLFASAAIHPGAVSQEALGVLQRHGHDMGTARCQGLDQIPNLEHYQIVIALSPSGRKAFPKPPTKAICLDWNLDAESAPDEAGYERMYRSLSTQIRELAEAVLGEQLESRGPA